MTNEVSLRYPPAQPSACTSTAGDWPRPPTVHAGFARQAALRPDAVALVSHDGEVTYGALEAQANRLARWLQGRGIGPGSFVATLLPRSPEAVVAFLAVLKAGAAFVPLDPGYPPELLDVIVEDSAPGVVLADAALLQGCGAAGWLAPTVLAADAFAAAAELSAAIDMELAAVRADQVRLWIQTAMVQACAADIGLTDHRRRCGASSARVWTRRLTSWIRACGTACA